MSILQIIFYAFAAMAIFSGMMVVASKNPVRGVLFLVFAFFATAGLWMLLNAEFLALILVLVYVGAVMTLFLFVVMMLNIDFLNLSEGFVRYLPFAVIILLAILGMSLIVLGPKYFGLSVVPDPGQASGTYNNIAALGSVLYTDYAYPFEVAAVLLLTAIVAAICLTHRKPVGRKNQNPAAQIAVNPKDRMRLIKLPNTPKVEK